MTFGQEIAHPGRWSLFVAVTVGVVVHDLTVVDTALLVYLPEDDTTAFRGAQPITQDGMEELLECQVPHVEDGLTELTLYRQAGIDHGPGVVEGERFFIQSLPDGLEGVTKHFVQFHKKRDLRSLDKLGMTVPLQAPLLL